MQQTSIDDQVLDFYDGLFGKIFSEPFRQRINERRRLSPVIRQVEESTEAASSSLTRFFLSQKLSDEIVKNILESFSGISNFLVLENISNPNVTTEEIVENLLTQLACPHPIHQTNESVYRLSLHTVVQVLMLVGPVMAEWQRLNFSSTFELPRRVVNRLNEISAQINAQGLSGQAGADENYELLYRDYLLQRFHRVEAGTVRMTTNLDVDLRELFVMPNVKVRELSIEAQNLKGAALLMGLAEARKLFGAFDGISETEAKIKAEKKKDKKPHSAFDQIKRARRNVVVGLPGVGKSTFFEWLQVKLASVEEKLPIGGGQAIPLLIRVRQLDMSNLPQGASLIEKATASKDRANLMPDGWIDRQMKAGRVLFMLDGLDETEPELRDEHLIPWLTALIKKYPKCHYLISSRPVGYPSGLLLENKFVECDLLDFDEPQIREYTRHWCTAVRLARNELEAEAREEGKREGDEIVDGFREHPYIRNLARNPLMLSAICLINYFEGGKLPKDRALLYKLCVEGLLHNWDQRRGIHSVFSLSEKLRVCREVALAMQNEDKAEADAKSIRQIFGKILKDKRRADSLLEHIRYRTGLLIERRADVFGFAHLTFQEYLAALAVHEGNLLGINKEQLVREHDDGRWNEVIALYCGLATISDVRNLIGDLIAQPDTLLLAEVLVEAYLSSNSEIIEDSILRQRVLKRAASSPYNWGRGILHRFPDDEITPIANNQIGKIKTNKTLSLAYNWLSEHPYYLDTKKQIEKLYAFHNLTPVQITEIIYILHRLSSDKILSEVAKIPGLYTSAGPVFENGQSYSSQADIALRALHSRLRLHSKQISSELIQELLQIFMDKLISYKDIEWSDRRLLNNILTEKNFILSLETSEVNEKLVVTARRLSNHLKTLESSNLKYSQNYELENLVIRIETLINFLSQMKRKQSSNKSIAKKDKPNHSKSKGSKINE